MKLLFRPVAIAAGLLAGLVARSSFKRLWKLTRHEDEAPKPMDRDRGWGEVVGAALVEGALFAGVKALVDRGAAKGFARATGVWPGRTETKDTSD